MWLNGQESACQCRECRFDPWIRKFPGEWQSIPIFLSGKSHGQKEPGGLHPWSHKRVSRSLPTKQRASKKLSSMLQRLRGNSNLGLPTPGCLAAWYMVIVVLFEALFNIIHIIENFPCMYIHSVVCHHHCSPLRRFHHHILKLYTFFSHLT